MLQVPASTPPVRVLVSSTWRSGSTLLGEVLAAHPGAYYHYEPLMPYGLQQLGPTQSNQVPRSLYIMKIMTCNMFLLYIYVSAYFPM